MSSSTIEKRFTELELTQLLSSAAEHLVRQCREQYCEPAPPENFVFLLTSNEAESLTPQIPCDAAAAAKLLLRDDGSFRDWVNLQPLGTLSDATVLQLVYAAKYTTRLLVGPLAFPFEPFHLLGPDLPASWMEGQPIPKVALTRLDLV